MTFFCCCWSFIVSGFWSLLLSVCFSVCRSVLSVFALWLCPWLCRGSVHGSVRRRKGEKHRRKGEKQKWFLFLKNARFLFLSEYILKKVVFLDDLSAHIMHDHELKHERDQFMRALRNMIYASSNKRSDILFYIIFQYLILKNKQRHCSEAQKRY